MKFSRTTLAATLCSALVLTACSGEDPAEEQDPSPAATQTSAVTADDAANTTDDAAVTDQATTTAGATDDEDTTEVAMATDEITAALPLQEAEEAARTVLTARFEADQGDGEDIEEAQQRSMTGSVLTAHQAADRLEPVTGEPTQVDLEAEALEPIVLAISKDDGELPVLMLVQTVPEEGGIPLLHLLESSTGEGDDFRISWEAPMLPGTELPSFERRSVGSDVLRSGSGDLTISPPDLLRSVASYISYPQPEDIPDYRTHGYAPAVRSAAKEQADAVAGQASYREKNWLVSEDTRTLLFDDGTAFVMGTLLRDSKFRVNSGSELNPPDTFRAFQDSAVLTDEAVLQTLVFVGMRAPSEQVDFKPEMIAAREQVVDAWGE